MEGLPQGYRPNVGVCLLNSHQQIFVASRLNVPGAWQMPQGGIEDGEEPRTAALRELQEETGIVSAEIIAEVPHWLTYDFPPSVKAKVNRLWGGQWNGQAQKWFLMRFTQDDSEVKLGNGMVDSEFSEWKWARPEEVIEQVHYNLLTKTEKGICAIVSHVQGHRLIRWGAFMNMPNFQACAYRLAPGGPEVCEKKFLSNHVQVRPPAVDYKRPAYEEVIRTFTPYFNSK